MFSDVFEIKRTWQDAADGAGATRAATDANGAPDLPDLPEVADAPPIASALPDQVAGGWLGRLKARLAAMPARQQETA